MDIFWSFLLHSCFNICIYIVPRIIKKNHTSIPLLMLHSYGKYPALITTFILFLSSSSTLHINIRSNNKPNI